MCSMSAAFPESAYSWSYLVMTTQGKETLHVTSNAVDMVHNLNRQ
jgi:hypothetical protein